jgi:hypothetical protein
MVKISAGIYDLARLAREVGSLSYAKPIDCEVRHGLCRRRVIQYQNYSKLLVQGHRTA